MQRGMSSFFDNRIYSLVKIHHWWSSLLCFYFLCTVCLHIFCNFVVAKIYCSPTTNLFAHLFVFCTVLYLSRVGYPEGVSHQQPKVLWAAVDCKKNYCRVSLYGQQYTRLSRLGNWEDWYGLKIHCFASSACSEERQFCGAKSRLKIKSCKIITLTF